MIGLALKTITPAAEDGVDIAERGVDRAQKAKRFV